MNNEHIIVCPFDRKLIASMKKRALVILTDDYNLVRYINSEVNRENKLHAIRLTLSFPLSELKVEDDWRDIPLLIESGDFGQFKQLIHQMNALRQLNIRIFLNADKSFNFTGLQILSSLQISSGLVMDRDFNSWEESIDLMHYAIYGRTKHAPIEPFDYIASQYGPRNFLDYNTVYFNNPEKYLHLNEAGQVALTPSDLEAGNFIAENLEELELESNEDYLAYLDTRHKIMLSMNDCAFCPALRICLGKFGEKADKQDGCKKFFSEMMDAADFYQLKHNKNNRLWQW